MVRQRADRGREPSAQSHNGKVKRGSEQPRPQQFSFRSIASGVVLLLVVLLIGRWATRDSSHRQVADKLNGKHGVNTDGGLKRSSHNQRSTGALPTPPVPRDRPPLQPRKKLMSSDPFYVNAPVPRLLPVYLTPVLSQEECEWIISLAETIDDWRPRLSYDTREVSVLEQLPKLVAWMKAPGGVQQRIFDLFRRQFKLRANQKLTVDNSNIIRYDHADKDTNHVMMHADGSLFTFNVLLSKPTSFGGGGTGMMHLNSTVWPERGEALTYYGNMYHSGEPVISGRRYIWQAFCRLDGGSSDESIAKVPRKETEMQVAFGQKALALHPGLYDAWFSVGNLMRKLGRSAETVSYLHKALEAGHKDPVSVYGKLAEAHSHLGDTKKLMKYMRKVVELDPSDYETREQLEMFEEQLGRRR